MDVQTYFETHVNEAVSNVCDGKDCKGQEIQILVPVPASFAIDCNDVSGINLDNARISVPGVQSITDEKGNVLLDAAHIGATLYRVEGVAR